MDLVLTLLSGPQAGHMMRVKGARIVIGRGHGSKIRIPSGSVSRSHSLITWQPSEGGYFMVEDMGSTNGTYVNAIQVVNPVVLLPGDDLMVGSVSFRVNYTMKPKSLKSFSQIRSDSGYPPPGAPPLPTEKVPAANDTDDDIGSAPTLDHQMPVAEVAEELAGFAFPSGDQDSDYIAVEDLDNLVMPGSTPIDSTPAPPKASPAKAPPPPPPSKSPPASPPPGTPLTIPVPDDMIIPFFDDHHALDLDALEQSGPPAKSAAPPNPPAAAPKKPAPPKSGSEDRIPLLDDDDDDNVNPFDVSSADLILPQNMHMADLARLLQGDNEPPPPKRK